MKRASILAVVVLALGAALGLTLTAGSGAAAKKKPRARPNVVFVLTDDLAKDLVPYMPHVRDMQRRGVSFPNYFVTDSLCCPSRSTIFTGNFPHNTKVFTNRPPDGGFGVFRARGEERNTFATALQRKGYRTAMMGKYLNGYKARFTQGSTTGYVPPGWNEWAVADNGYPEYNYDLNVNGTVEHHGATPADYLTDVVAAKGIRFIDRQVRARKPFLLEIATFAPHAPYTPAPADVGKFAKRRAPRGPAFDHQNVNPPRWLGRRLPLRPGQIRKIDSAFRRRVRAVQSVDRMLGALEAELVKRGIAKNTYVVFSSDNGYHMGQRRLMPGKQTAFDHDISVPLVVTGPKVPAGRRVGAIAQNTDLRPTFSAIGGAKIPSAIDGRSLLGLLHGKRVPADWRAGALVEHHGPNDAPGDPDAQPASKGNPTTYEALRTSSFLWVEYVNGEREYYDLKKDPSELVNIAGKLSKRRRAQLHARILRLERCKGGRSCRKAGRG